MKKGHIISILILLISIISFAGNMENADQLFKDNLFSKALTEYTEIYEKSPDSSDKWDAFYKIIQCLQRLYKYEESSQKILNADLPSESRMRARMLFLKIDTLSSLKNIYGQVISKERIISDDSKTDVMKLSDDEIETLIFESYKQLYILSEVTSKMELSQEERYFNVENIDMDQYKTLFDFYIHRFSLYLLSKNKDKIKTKDLFDKSFRYNVDFADPYGELAINIIAFGENEFTENREVCAENWKITRINTIMSSGAFEYDNVDTVREKVTKDLLYFMDHLKEKPARARAGYMAATYINQQQNYVKSVDLLEYIKSEFSSTDYSVKAENLINSIKARYLNVSLNIRDIKRKNIINVNTRNVEKFYYRIYKIDPYEYRTEWKSLHENRRFNGWSSLLSSVDHKWVEECFYKQKVFKEGSYSTDDTGEYKYINKDYTLPVLDKDLYLLAVSDDSEFILEKNIITLNFLNITSNNLLVSSGQTSKSLDVYNGMMDSERVNGEKFEDNIHRIYVINGDNGQGIADENINLYFADKENRQGQESVIKTDKEGIAEIPIKINPSFSYSYNFKSIDPLVKNKDGYAYFNRSFNASPVRPDIFRMEIFTDRAIYRPEDTVYVKLNGLKRKSDGFEVASEYTKIDIQVRDFNGKNIVEKKLKFNEFGGVSFDFQIPSGRLLGDYSITASCLYMSQRFSAYKNFKVEEYKKPEFEVLVDDIDENVIFGDKVNIKGKLEYYSGGIIPGTQVKLNIYKKAYIPWFFRWYYYSFNSSDTLIFNTETVTDNDGKFSILWKVPEESETGRFGSFINQYRVEVIALGQGGRSITGEMSFRASDKAGYIAHTPEKTFFYEKDNVKITSVYNTNNDIKINGKGYFKLYRLEDRLNKKESEEIYNNYINSQNAPLYKQLSDVPYKDIVREGKTIHKSDSDCVISFDGLKKGNYRLIEIIKDERTGKEIKGESIIVVTDPDSSYVNIPACSVNLVSKNEFSVGEKANIIFGSIFSKGKFFIEIWSGNYLVDRFYRGNGEKVQSIRLPIKNEYLGGFNFKWFGVNGSDVLKGNIYVNVPYNHKNLDVEFEDLAEKMMPDKDVSARLYINDINGKGVDSEYLCYMYDSSLDYYSKDSNSFFGNLYNKSQNTQYVYDSVFNPYIYYIRVKKGIFASVYNLFRKKEKHYSLPSVKSYSNQYHNYGIPRMRKGMALMESAFMDRSAKVSEADALVQSAGAMEKEISAEAEVSYDKVRTNFSDTAFFIPYGRTSDGNGVLNFKTPSNLTRWTMKLFAITKDLKITSTERSIQTAKDLMVRINTSRFVREKDKASITLIVQNESTEKVNGKLYIDFFEDGKKVNHKLNVSKNIFNFNIKSKGTFVKDISIDVPMGITDYTIKAKAVTNDLSDGEEKTLPVLPGYQRILKSKVVMLEGEKIEELKLNIHKDADVIHEKAFLQVEPSLILNLLNTIPYLVDYPYACVEQTMNKYVPVAVMSKVFETYPELKKAVSKIPERDTRFKKWKKVDGLRLSKMMETPWVRSSEGGGKRLSDLISLVDPQNVEVLKDYSLERLKNSQNGDGGFPWWPGGKSHFYITLYILNGFAQAMEYGVKPPMDIVENALRYLKNNMDKLKDREKRNLNTLSYACYVLSHYIPEKYKNSEKGLEFVRKWLYYLEENLSNISPLCKAYVAVAYYNLKNPERAGEILEMALDGSQYDEKIGLYWTPERFSWLWYSDTVEKHAFFIKAVNLIKPGDKRASQMVKWLLVNKKNNVWKSTKTSVCAMFSILDHMKKNGALEGKERYDIKWGKIKDSIDLSFDDFTDKPFVYSLEGKDISSENYTAIIDKKGKGTGFVSLSMIYSQYEDIEEDAGDYLSINREFYNRVKKGDMFVLIPLRSNDKVKVGDEIIVKLKISSKSQFEYIHIKDPKGATFENKDLLSGWLYSPIRMYREQRDSLTNFFIDWLPHGDVELSYTINPVKAGVYKIAAATIQSMYSPEIGAHSSSMTINVEK